MERTVKYEEVFSVPTAMAGKRKISLARFLCEYCHVRPHSSLGGQNPHEGLTVRFNLSSRPRFTMSGAESCPIKSHPPQINKGLCGLPCSSGANAANQSRKRRQISFATCIAQIFDRPTSVKSWLVFLFAR